ncbi:MAG: hypothetical protein PHE49_10250 [bacterium]|nr:hypothetical protein [bacterium]
MKINLKVVIFLLLIGIVIDNKGIAEAENTKGNAYENAIEPVKYKDRRFNNPLIVYEKIDGAVKYSHLEISQDGKLSFSYGENSLESSLKRKYLSRIIEIFKGNIWKEGEGDSYDKWACPDSGNGIIRYKLTFKKKTFYTSSKDTLSQVFLNIIPELNDLTDAIKQKEKELWKSVLIQHEKILCVWERNDILGIRKNGKVYSIGKKGICNFVKTLKQDEMQQMINLFNEKKVFELGTVMQKFTESTDEDTVSGNTNSVLTDSMINEHAVLMRIDISGPLMERKSIKIPTIPYPDWTIKQGTSVSFSMQLNVDSVGNVIGQPVILSKTGYSDWDDMAVKWIVERWKWETISSGETQGCIKIQFPSNTIKDEMHTPSSK